MKLLKNNINIVNHQDKTEIVPINYLSDLNTLDYFLNSVFTNKAREYFPTCMAHFPFNI